MKTIELSGLLKALSKNKYVLLMLVAGLVLLLLPDGEAGEETHSIGSGSELQSSGIPVDTESERIAELLGYIQGVGSAKVLLSGEGAVVVCEGSDSPGVRLDVTNAVMAYTGLGSDKISILKMK